MWAVARPNPPPIPSTSAHFGRKRPHLVEAGPRSVNLTKVGRKWPRLRRSRQRPNLAKVCSHLVGTGSQFAKLGAKKCANPCRTWPTSNEWAMCEGEGEGEGAGGGHQWPAPKSGWTGAWSVGHEGGGLIELQPVFSSLLLCVVLRKERSGCNVAQRSMRRRECPVGHAGASARRRRPTVSRARRAAQLRAAGRRLGPGEPHRREGAGHRRCRSRGTGKRDPRARRRPNTAASSGAPVAHTRAPSMADTVGDWGVPM